MITAPCCCGELFSSMIVFRKSKLFLRRCISTSHPFARDHSVWRTLDGFIDRFMLVRHEFSSVTKQQCLTRFRSIVLIWYEEQSLSLWPPSLCPFLSHSLACALVLHFSPRRWSFARLVRCRGGIIHGGIHHRSTASLNNLLMRKKEGQRERERDRVRRRERNLSGQEGVKPIKM